MATTIQTQIPEEILENSGVLTTKLVSSATNSTSTTNLASSKAVKDAYDHATSVGNASVAKTSISDAINSNVSTTVASSKAVKDAYDHATDVGNASVAKTSISSAVNSSSESTVASSKALKETYELAAGAQTVKVFTQEETLTATSAIAAGGKYILNQSYVVGRNSIEVYLDGVFCPMGSNYVWEEVGTKDQYSTQIKFNLAIPAGSHLFIRVFIAAVNLAVPNAIGVQDNTARDKATQALSEAQAANTLAAKNKTLVCTEKDYSLDSAGIALNGTLTVDSYAVGKKYIQVWLDGVYLPVYNATSSPNGCWEEVISSGQEYSTKIKFLIAIPGNSIITVRVWSKPN